jgi:hypothetical protein
MSNKRTNRAVGAMGSVCGGTEVSATSAADVGATGVLYRCLDHAGACVSHTGIARLMQHVY